MSESTPEPKSAGPISTATEEPPGPTFLTEEEFRALLTVQDIEPFLQDKADLKATQFIDLKQMLDQRGVQQMFPLDSGFSIFFVNEDETKSIRLGVFDMRSLVDATNQYEEVKARDGLNKSVDYSSTTITHSRPFPTRLSKSQLDYLYLGGIGIINAQFDRARPP